MGEGRRRASLTCGMSVHGKARIRSVWRLARERASSVHTGIMYMRTHRMGGRTYL